MKKFLERERRGREGGERVRKREKEIAYFPQDTLPMSA